MGLGFSVQLQKVVGLRVFEVRFTIQGLVSAALISRGSKGVMKVGQVDLRIPSIFSTILGLISHTPPPFTPPFEPLDTWGLPKAERAMKQTVLTSTRLRATQISSSQY